ncbi:hypothetical protein GALMADRAFT_891893 [Galerina marginata CBS 339.88]|uniref:Uncharacterized protein n=1 Tax=Galerina marginata (strain CBS 339.88) TaxID=685588 RepID=A0A067SR83_GALM3|nr:hypothetical protein GALMADRAFT_891893 [Galerina marginata CBS 339.88]
MTGRGKVRVIDASWTKRQGLRLLFRWSCPRPYCRCRLATSESVDIVLVLVIISKVARYTDSKYHPRKCPLALHFLEVSASPRWR